MAGNVIKMELFMNRNSEDQENKAYEVCVSQFIHRDWCDWFAGMTLTHEFDQEGQPFSIMQCTFEDQSSLFGFLAQLHSMNLKLIFVYQIGSKIRRLL